MRKLKLYQSSLRSFYLFKKVLMAMLYHKWWMKAIRLQGKLPMRIPTQKGTTLISYKKKIKEKRRTRKITLKSKIKKKSQKTKMPLKKRTKKITNQLFCTTER